jgi:hypothetical protein
MLLATGGGAPCPCDMRIALALAILSCSIIPASLRAEPTPARDVSRMVTDDCARARKAGKTCVLEVPAEDINGTTPASSDVSVGIIRFGTAASLIHLRRDFVPEIVNAAEDL